MPRLQPEIQECVGYLYETVADAERGSEFGGTAFLVSYPSKVGNGSFLYAVTNWHVAVRDGASCLRINTISGKPDIFDLGPEDWHFDPQFDVAVADIALSPETHKFRMISLDMFLTKEDIAEAQITAGEDVFMVGRFVDHDGGSINRPAMRFGNISVMPFPIHQFSANGKMADAYCIDLHSRSGYSGAPVFVYRTPGNSLVSHQVGKGTLTLVSDRPFLKLLGVHYAQFPEEWEIKAKSAKTPDKKPANTNHSVPMIEGGKYIKGLSGMACVLPSWTIQEVLEMPILQKQREREEAEIEAKAAQADHAIPTAESAHSSDANPTRREDFNRLLDAAARKPKQDD